MRKLWEALLSLLYPRRCLFCGKLTDDPDGVCAQCRGEILWPDATACPLCGRRREECACRPEHLPVWDGCAAVAYYGERVKAGIAAFKFHRRSGAGPGLGKLMAGRVKVIFPGVSFDWIIPAPLSRKRLKERGYNQAGLLARKIAGELGAKVLSNALQKDKDTPQQSRLSRRERLLSLRGAFRVKDPASVAGKTILLVDDVTTTGATLAECVKTLKKAGAARVYCAVFALSVPYKIPKGVKNN